jgi:putative PIN family toxin of toxin-antitoxin system
VIIVLDTNVLVSALLNPSGRPADVLRLVLNGDARPAYDARILDEYRSVLTRPRFSFDLPGVAALLDFIAGEGLAVCAAPTAAALPDATDRPFLEVAVSARADALVSGNKRHFPAAAKGPLAVLTPAELLLTLTGRS